MKKLIRRLNNTYQKLYRDRHLIARHFQLSDSEYRLWDLMIALYDWDEKHKDNFLTVQITDREIAVMLGWSSSKSCRIRNCLLKKLFIKKIESGSYRVFSSEEVKQRIPNMKQIIAKMQDINSPVKQEIAPMKQNQTQNDPNTIVSYKDEYKDKRESGSKKVLIGQGRRTDEEYREIQEAGKYQKLTIDDMHWIDENIKETKRIDSPATEKDIVEIFFAGDWENYRKHLIV